jgi:hypothetical protein
METRTGLLASLYRGRRDGRLVPRVDFLRGLRACVDLDPAERVGWVGRMSLSESTYACTCQLVDYSWPPHCQIYPRPISLYLIHATT